MSTVDKSQLPSRHVTEGMANALHRIYYHAMGLDAESIHRPMVGVAAVWGDSLPSRDAPLEAARNAERGVWANGAVPRTFATIVDGDHEGRPLIRPRAGSLVDREIVADSVELTVRGHSYDAVVGIAPTAAGIMGLLMAMCRLDVPAAVLPLVDPAFGLDDDAVAAAMVCESLGFTPTGANPVLGADLSTTAAEVGAVAARRLRKGLPARQLITSQSLDESARVLGAASASPHLLVDLVAVAAEAGVVWTLEDGVRAMRGVEGLVDAPRDLTGADTLLEARVLSPDRSAPAQDPSTGNPGPPTVGTLAGSLCGSALVRARPGLVSGTARVFASEDNACAALSDDEWGDRPVVLVVRGQGPVGAPGMRRLDRLARLTVATGHPEIVALVSDGRVPNVPGVATVSAVEPEAALDGPLSTIADGDRVTLDVTTGRLDVEPGSSRRASVEVYKHSHSAVLAKYIRFVGTARTGAMTHPGAAGERKRYADL